MRRHALMPERQRLYHKAVLDLRKAKRYMGAAQYQREIARRTRVEGMPSRLGDPPEGYCSSGQWRRLFRKAGLERRRKGRGMEEETVGMDVGLGEDDGEGSMPPVEQPAGARKGVLGRVRGWLRL